MTVDIVMKPVLRAEIFIRYVKTNKLLYRLTSGSLWCAWQRHSTNPTNQSAPKYRCSKHFAITRWSLPPICINHNPFVKFQFTHKHLRSQKSHYVLLAVVGDKDIVIELCWCKRREAINQRCISMEEIKLWGKYCRSTTLQCGIHSESEHLIWKVELGGEKKVMTVHLFHSCHFITDNQLHGTSYTHRSLVELLTLNVLISVH